MAYEHERDEWRSAVRRSTDQELYVAANAQRWAQGFHGEYDACEGCHQYLDDDADD